MSKWQPIETAPRDGTAFLVWEIVVCDEEDEDGGIIARNQRYERAVIANWMWGSLAEPSGRMRPSNGRWDHWMPLPAPPVSELESSSEHPAKHEQSQ